MIFPQPPWSLLGVYRSHEIEAVKAKLMAAKVPFEVKDNEPTDLKPFSIWVHDDHLQAAIDAI